MEEKLSFFIRLGVFLFLIWYVFHLALQNQGSSEKFMTTQNYQNMFEIQIEDTFDLGIVVNKKGIAYHLFFFQPAAKRFYNQEIEGHSLNEALSMIISTLVEEKELTNDSHFEVVCYGDFLKEELLNDLKESFKEYDLSSDISVVDNTLEEKAKTLEIGSTKKTIILWGMEVYSQDMIRSSDSLPSSEELTKELAREYSDNIYHKLEKIIQDKNLLDFNKDNVPLALQKIPADSKGIYYPNEHSWYSANAGKINAYIEFSYKNTSYGFCYKETVEKVLEEECS